MTQAEAMTVVKVAKMLGIAAETLKNHGAYSVVIRKTIIENNPDLALRYIRGMAKAVG